MLDREPLIIVGSSVRAAAQSAHQAGFAPWCIDQFADRDLVEVSKEATTVADWPNGIGSAFETTPDAAWLYTGALENSPALIDRLAEMRTLLGCDSETLLRLRNPAWLAQTLSKASLPNLPIFMPNSSDQSTLPVSSSDNGHQNFEWMAKPLVSAGGLDVREFDGTVAKWDDREGNFLQKRVSGRVVSGLYFGSGSSARLLGMSEQLCRGSEAGEFSYVYSGSLGPLSADDMPATTFQQAQKVGSAIIKAINSDDLSIRGLFGIDFVLDNKTDDLWTLEVNPRYTASAELYEREFGWPLVAWHVDACRQNGIPTREQRGGPSLTLRDTSSHAVATKPSHKHGKLIVYARQNFTAPDIVHLVEQFKSPSVLSDAPSSIKMRQDAPGDNSRITVADIPRIGMAIGKDEPVCTLLTKQQSSTNCHSQLTTAADALLTLIDRTSW